METILVQETDSATLEVLTLALEMKGYKVCSLFDQRENALDMIKRHRPKVVLLDCWLSHYSDSQISRWIKAHFPALPVIAFSCDNQIDKEYLRLGFDGYLKKPFDLETLYLTIKKFAHRSKARCNSETV